MMSLGTKMNNCLREAGGCAGSFKARIKVEIPETRCKTELWQHKEAAANETRASCGGANANAERAP
ncbi:hypothetical protein NIES2130_24070 [Scytonema sp. HK-05]|nr:hypothetical protein NIES2130_24070 [Scytonema sp. HK-05]